jgi:hypothetical protein
MPRQPSVPNLIGLPTNVEGETEAIIELGV